jgi:archaellum component FlaC
MSPPCRHSSSRRTPRFPKISAELKEAAKLPRVTKEDLTLVLEPMGQRLTNAESELRQQREVIAGVDKRLNQSENEISIIKLSIPEERAK